MKTPIALFIYNRPKNVKRLINAIKKIKPKRIYVYADGPKNKKDKIKCLKVINEVKKITWTKNLHIHKLNKNIGLKKNIKRGLDMIFKKHKMAIILEDDCIPNHSFLKFAESLLHHYKNNQKIAGISGNNFNNYDIKHTYYFSKYSSIWGWATWSRVWKTVDINITFWKNFKKTEKWKNKFKDKSELKFWTNIFNDVKNGKFNSWAYPYLLSNFYHNRFTIVPKKNLVTNVGFGKEATNTFKANKIYLLKNNKLNLKKIIHPTIFKNYEEADYYDFLNVYGGKSIKFPRNIYNYFKQQI